MTREEMIQVEYDLMDRITDWEWPPEIDRIFTEIFVQLSEERDQLMIDAMTNRISPYIITEEKGE